MSNTVPPSQSGDRSEADLQRRFTLLWQRCTLPGRPAQAPWELLERGYSAPDRHYHSLHHIDSCLREFDSAAKLAVDPDAVEMALWFHDVILDPVAPDNERRSAELFASTARASFDAAFVAAVQASILATTHSAPVAERDRQLVCDIDLWSLGAQWPRFLADSRALWAESHAGWEAYVAGKRRFYAALCQQPRIFQMDRFRDCYERPARDNMQRLLAMFERGETL